MDEAATLLEVEHLNTWFETEQGDVRAVDDLTIRIPEGETLGLVGESGSGKSVTALSVMRLLPEISARVKADEVSLLGRDLVKLPDREMRRIRGRDISMIFQEPGTSLNPVFKAGKQVMEAIILHQKVSKAEARRRTIELFREVGIPEPERRVDSYPHEMSGGQKQRVMIAMALACRPDVLIADWMMPSIDGLELTRRVKKLDESAGHFTYVLLLTARDLVRLIQQARKEDRIKFTALTPWPAATHRTPADIYLKFWESDLILQALCRREDLASAARLAFPRLSG